MKEPIDVLVLTPLPPELAALRAELGQPDEEGATLDFSYVIWRNVELKDRPEGGRLVVVMPLEKDQIPAGNTTHLALNRWTPECFVLMGIAGQLRARAKLGDVVVGRHVLQWDAKRKERDEVGNEDQTAYALTPAPSARWGANLANLLRSDIERYETWRADCERARPPEIDVGAPELHVEDVASGSATIDSAMMREMLSNLSRYLYVVETEAAAALVALHSRDPSSLSILIRGVSDPSARKQEFDALGEGAWRRYAAGNAARLLVLLLRTYPINSPQRANPTAAYSFPRLEALVNRGDTVRKHALEPQKLLRIAREPEKECLTLLRAAVTEGLARCVGIVAPAGYGKTSLLGAIYDGLRASDVPWILVVRCGEIGRRELESEETLIQALGIVASGSGLSADHLATHLQKQYGLGAILLDTVDAILERETLTFVRRALERLHSHCVLVFTCRQAEFSAFLQPVEGVLPFISERFYLISLPEFNPTEVHKATVKYLRRLKPDTDSAAHEQFAKTLNQLAADRRPIQEIVQNPLLLSLLCEIYGPEGRIPADLTVSILFNAYWDQRIAKSTKVRVPGDIGLAKESLCLDIAARLFRTSGERLTNSFFQTDIEFAHERFTQAWADLISEGVLKPLGVTGRIEFFHDTFLEYVVARWLVRLEHDHEWRKLVQKASLSSQVSTNVQTADRGWWPVVRQFAAVAPTRALDELVASLDHANFEAFRAVTLGVAARRDPQRLLELLPMALKQGGEHELVMVEAAEMAAPRARELAWQLSMTLLEGGGQGNTAVKAAQSLHFLIADWDTDLRLRLQETFDTLNRRFPKTKRGKGSSSAAGMLTGWIVKSFIPILNRMHDPGALETLRARFFTLGDSAAKWLIHRHEGNDVAPGDAVALLEKMSRKPLAKHLHAVTTQLLAHLLRERSDEARSWFQEQYENRQRLRSGWPSVLEAALGQAERARPEQIGKLLAAALKQTDQDKGTSILTVLEALNTDTATSALVELLAHDPREIPPDRLRVLSAILERLAASVTMEQANALVTWLESEGLEHPADLVSGVTALAPLSDAACQLAFKMLERVAEDKRSKFVLDFVRRMRADPKHHLMESLPILIPNNLSTSDASVARVEIAALRATANAYEVQNLVNYAVQGSPDIARLASRRLVELATTAQGLDADTLNTLALSPVPGVRVYWLRAVGAILRRQGDLENDKLLKVIYSLRQEKDEHVLHEFRRLIVRWDRSNPTPSLEVCAELGALAKHWMFARSGRATFQRVGVTIVRCVAAHTSGSLAAGLADLTMEILERINTRGLRDGERQLAELIEALARSVPRLFERIIAMEQRVIADNWRSVARTIRRLQGSHSPLLTEILTAVWCPNEVRAEILRERGS